MRVNTVFGAVALLVSLILSVPALADAPENLGPEVGSKLPAPFAAVDSEGAAQDFDSIKGEKGAVLVFYRSARWCPFCQMQLMNMNQISADLKAKGYPVVGISYDEPSVLANFKDRRLLDFTLLSDKESTIINAFGILNPEYPEGHMAHGVPYPLIAIYGADGTLKTKLYEAAYSARPTNEVILEAIDQIS